MEEKTKMDIEIGQDVADGIYSNLAVISHSPSEFITDYIRLMPGAPKAKVVSRIIMVPEHAKRLMLALQDNIRKYEDHFGVININEPPVTPFNPNRGEA